VGETVRIAAEYSFNNGADAVRQRYAELLAEVKAAIQWVDASKHKTKSSKEKTMPGQMHFSPVAINEAFKRQLYPLDWKAVRVPCTYATEHYVTGYTAKPLRKGAFREMDFVKRKLGVEVQLGKYAFMVYNVAAKMTIFSNLGYIDAGIEVVPVKALADEMSSGVSYFEQFVWDLQQRGVSDIDIPVLIIGIDV
jgi:hypothetical protein